MMAEFREPVGLFGAADLVKNKKKNTGMKTTEKKTTVAAGTTGAARAFTELRMRTLNGANLRFGYMPPKKVRERIDW